MIVSAFNSADTRLSMQPRPHTRSCDIFRKETTFHQMYMREARNYNNLCARDSVQRGWIYKNTPRHNQERGGLIVTF